MQKKKWLSILIAVAISVGLWVYVVAVKNPEGEMELNNVPVFFSGEDVLRDDHDLILTDSNIKNGVTLTFYGKLSDLNKLRDGKSDLAVTVNVNHLRNAQTYNLSYDLSDVTLPSSLSASDIELHQVSPKSVEITVENLAKKPVDVRVQQNVTMAEGFMTSRMTQSYEQITVEGPAELVEQVSYAQAILERENVDQNISATLPLTLIDKNGEIISGGALTTSVSEIEVSVPVLMYKEVPLVPSFVYAGGITEADVVSEVEPRFVRLTGEASALESVQNITLSNIDLASLPSNNETLTRSIPIPTDCTMVSGEQQEAVVSVQIKNKTITRIRVSSSHFQYIGLSDDLAAVPKTTVLSIIIRCNEADADQITEDHLRVVADCTGLSTTKNLTMPVKIYVDGFEGAGVVAEADYSILMDVVPVEDLDTQTEG